MTDMREAVARAIYDADEDAITANIDSSPNLSDEAKREWHESIGPKVAWEDIHPETREAYLARADAALSLMQPEIDRRVAEEREKLLQRLREPSEGMLEAGGRCEGVILDDFDGVVVFPRRIWQAMLAQFEKENSDG